MVERWKRRNQTNSQCCGGTMAGNHRQNRKSRAEGLRDQKMHAGTEKRMLIRKLQKERRLKEYDEHEVTMTNIDSMSIARNNEKQMRIETDM